MFERIRRSISHPKYAFLYIKDKLSRVFLYILILTTIMSAPTIIIGILSPIQIVPDRSEISKNIDKFIDQDIKIENNILITPTNYNSRTNINMFHIVFGEIIYNDTGYFLVFEEDKITTYLSAGSGLRVISNEYSYESLNISNLEFNKSNKRKISNIIANTFANDSKIVTSIVISAFIVNFMDLLLLILFLSIIANMLRRLPIKFSDHFKINTYVSTIYAISSLILILFGLTYLTIIPFIVTYIYQVRAYSSIKIIKKIEVKNKDE